ncbi:hypothetical protein NP493_934g00003 [Ridgeia piscesae]|uniref:CTNNB1 binding N-teminal domain-containing protein n=1 Tax=Ridgeia piscesae TaxID=27915 RepID=A0AAD9KLB0_RIDPI|nr:hypothetical protein NP493_934g00003 [Ridgeia piscesae]
MPHVNSSGGDDLASTDEVKVYKDEGEEEKRSSENLSEDKLGLVTESEEGKSSDIEGRSYSADDKGSTSGQDGKPPEPPGIDRRLGPLGYPIISPYPYHNGASMLVSYFQHCSRRCPFGTCLRTVLKLYLHLSANWLEQSVQSSKSTGRQLRGLNVLTALSN